MVQKLLSVAAVASYQANLQLLSMTTGFRFAAFQQPTGVARRDSVHPLPEKKVSVNSLRRQRNGGLVRKGHQTRQLQPVLQPSFGCAHGQHGISSLRSGGDGHLYASSEQASTSDGRGATISPTPLQAGDVVGAQSLLQTILPEALWPYAQLARVDKPIGTWLLVWPLMWSLCLAGQSGTFPDLKLIALFGLWSVLMRGAGCTVNDMFDKDFDAKVERTRSRPFPSGSVSMYQGIFFLVFQISLALALTLPLSNLSQILGAVFVPLFFFYPLMKRWTYWPQAYLGIILNWGVLMGWSAIQNNLDVSVVLPLHASGFFWTLVYDTIYAHQDKEEDRLIGVKSTALLFGDKTKIILTGCSVACVALLALAGANCAISWPFYAGVAIAGGLLAWQVYTVDIDDAKDCKSKFMVNKWYGAIVCSAILLGKLALP